MRPTIIHRTRLFTALFAATALAACAGEAVGPVPIAQPQPGHAFLKIVGEDNVFLENGAARELIVKYVNAADEGLAGTVTFRLDGEANGGSLSATSAVTGPGGEVRIAVVGGSSAEAAFGVVAEAQYATPVNWRVSVRGPATPLPFKVEGTYRLESTFDMVSGIPGDVGEVVRAVIDMTDDPTDPTSWLLGLDPDVRNAIPRALDAVLNELLKEATTFTINGTRVSAVAKFQEFGSAFGEVAKKFGLLSKLEITKRTDGSYVGKHTVDGVFFRINGRRIDRTFAALNMTNIVVENIPLVLSGEERISIGEHNLQLGYAAMIVAAVENVVIPIITPRATTLREMLEELIDCTMVGGAIYDELGWPSVSFYDSLCRTAIAAGASILTGKLAEIEGVGSEFKIQGTVRLVDNNADRTIDALIGGEWTGRLFFGNEATTLAQGSQKFTGQRMGN
jgi:hypothetical protein